MGHIAADIALVAAGAAVGGVLRYFTVNYATFGAGSFAGTMTANVSGCFLIGIVWAVLQWAGTPRAMQMLLVTGLLGGYTTYSAYALDTVLMMAGGRIAAGLLYASSTAVAGIGACAAGLFLTRRILSFIQ